MAALADLLNPRLEAALAASADALADEDDLVSAQAAEALARARTGSGALRAQDVLALHPALQRRVLLAAALEAGGRPERLHLEELRILLARPRAEGPAALHLPGAEARLRRGLLSFSALPPRSNLDQDAQSAAHTQDRTKVQVKQL
jgi:hypothetical protein